MRGLLRLVAMAIFLLVFVVGGLRPAEATAIPEELHGLGTIANWDVSEPQWNWELFPELACGIKDGRHRYDTILMNHDVGSKLDNATATQQVKLLDDKVVRYLEQKSWAVMDVGPAGGQIPNTKRCYQKQGVIVQVYQTTGRCTMNTPCTAYDGFTVMIYTPKHELTPSAK